MANNDRAKLLDELIETRWDYHDTEPERLSRETEASADHGATPDALARILELSNHKCGDWINEERALYFKALVSNLTGSPQSALADADRALAVIRAHDERPLVTALLYRACRRHATSRSVRECPGASARRLVERAQYGVQLLLDRVEPSFHSVRPAFGHAHAHALHRRRFGVASARILVFRLVHHSVHLLHVFLLGIDELLHESLLLLRIGSGLDPVEAILHFLDVLLVHIHVVPAVARAMVVPAGPLLALGGFCRFVIVARGIVVVFGGRAGPVIVLGVVCVALVSRFVLSERLSATQLSGFGFLVVGMFLVLGGRS